MFLDRFRGVGAPLMISRLGGPTGDEPGRRSFDLVLLRRTRISANVMRITMGGFELLDFSYRGGDHRCSVFIPCPDEQIRRLMVPAIVDPWTGAAQCAFIAALSRPLRRRLTVRAFRPDLLELDFDIVLHGDSPLSHWTREAAPGTSVRVIDEGRKYYVARDTRWQLLAADEAGTPAALAVAESTPETVPTTVYLGGTSFGGERDAALGPHVTVIQVSRLEGNTRVGRALRTAVLDKATSMIPDKVGIAGERSFAKALCADLHAAGVPRKAIQAGIYWKAH
ncbi:siderophore-interacting protein [Nocardia rhamnosiphila]|uniref:siderophore-interacting protein n=1 Tax=Nocardia rhamnosiphila TaxID=426716 RepID=UPI0027E2CC9D|nr:siderophore-interacting protein [Nocardia zapadnayensis]